MASTSLDFEADAVVAPARRETAAPRPRHSGESLAKKRTALHRKLLKYLNRTLSKACPPYLRNDRDDIAQTVLIRLDGKLEEIVESLESCLESLVRHGRERCREAAEALRACLEEIAKACDRERTSDLKVQLQACLSSLESDPAEAACRNAIRTLEEGLSWLRERGGKEVFAESYVNRGIHWAIMDARKKLVRLAEVAPEEREDGTSEWDMRSGSLPTQRSLEIREEVSDCLSRLDESKRRPTYLALLGYGQNEIAGILDLSLPQAESRIRRGKAFLRDCLNSKGVSQ